MAKVRTGREEMEGRRGSEGQGKRERLADLIEKATNSILLHLDDRLITAIKAVVKSSDECVHAAFDVLFDQLKKNHSQVRYLTLLIIDQLFTRSKLFRALLVPEFETFTLLSVGFRSDYPLPRPEDRAVLLRKKSLEFVEKWNDNFGTYYKPIKLAHDYLKYTLRLEFPNLREAANLANQQRREREQRTQELLTKKFQTLKNGFQELRLDVQSNLDQVAECLTLLVPKDLKDDDKAGDVSPRDVSQVEGQAGCPHLTRSNDIVDVEQEEDEFEVYGAQSLRYLRNEEEYQSTVPQESTDNRPIFDTLRELHRLLVTRHLISTQDWLSTLMRVDPKNEQHSRDALLREVIDIRNQLLKARDKCEEVGIQQVVAKSAAEENLDDIVWETGDLSEITTAGINSTGSILSSVDCGNHEAKDSTDSASCSRLQIEGGSRKTQLPITGVKQDLMKEAPVLPWGSYLDVWGNEHTVPVNSRGLLFENHWGKVDYDALIPADKVAENNLRASRYEPEKKESPPCSAPLKKGGLCPRRDLHTCPLHGPIIPRDAHGNPAVEDEKRTSKYLSTTEKNTNVDLKLAVSDLDSGTNLESRLMDFTVEEIAAQAVSNVRRKEQSTKPGNTALTSARRQRTKRDREHNNVCLRAAAIAGTGQGIGEALGEVLDGQFVYNLERKKSRGGLSALLRKKPTAKDRLAIRLLNGRVRDANVAELTREQEARYRESFPNQWS